MGSGEFTSPMATGVGTSILIVPSRFDIYCFP